MLKSFRGWVVHAIEQYIDEQVSDDYVFPKRDHTYGDYFKRSIYNNKKIDLLKLKHLSRNINVNGIVIGSDSFLTLLVQVLGITIFIKAKLKMVILSKLLLKRAINYGVFTEKSVLGKLTSKVFSHADLEANYPGLFIE